MSAPSSGDKAPRLGSRYEQTHDGLCERIEVDIGVDIQTSPCGCMERWYERRLDLALGDADTMKACWDAACNDIAKLQAARPSLAAPEDCFSTCNDYSCVRAGHCMGLASTFQKELEQQTGDHVVMPKDFARKVLAALSPLAASKPERVDTAELVLQLSDLWRRWRDNFRIKGMGDQLDGDFDIINEAIEVLATPLSHTEPKLDGLTVMTEGHAAAVAKARSSTVPPLPAMVTPQEWAEADPEELEPWYSHWVSELTMQGLHAKADIATVLALLSQRITALSAIAPKQFAARCRPSVAHYLRTLERTAMSAALSQHAKEAAEKEAAWTGMLLDEIDAMIGPVELNPPVPPNHRPVA